MDQIIGTSPTTSYQDFQILWILLGTPTPLLNVSSIWIRFRSCGAVLLLTAAAWFLTICQQISVRCGMDFQSFVLTEMNGGYVFVISRVCIQQELGWPKPISMIKKSRTSEYWCTSGSQCDSRILKIHRCFSSQLSKHSHSQSFRRVSHASLSVAIIKAAWNFWEGISSRASAVSWFIKISKMKLIIVACLLFCILELVSEQDSDCWTEPFIVPFCLFC